jgi:hypothetical protein
MTDYELLRRYDAANLPVEDENYLPAVVEFLAEALDTHLVEVPGADEYLLFVPSDGKSDTLPTAPHDVGAALGFPDLDVDERGVSR